MRALGGMLIFLGLVVAVTAPHVANIENDIRHRARMRAIMSYSYGGTIGDVSAGPQAITGGMMAGLGILVLAIRRPTLAGSAACIACGGPASPHSRLCAWCRR